MNKTAVIKKFNKNTILNQVDFIMTKKGSIKTLVKYKNFVDFILNLDDNEFYGLGIISDSNKVNKLILTYTFMKKGTHFIFVKNKTDSFNGSKVCNVSIFNVVGYKIIYDNIDRFHLDNCSKPSEFAKMKVQEYISSLPEVNYIDLSTDHTYLEGMSIDDYMSIITS